MKAKLSEKPSESRKRKTDKEEFRISENFKIRLIGMLLTVLGLLLIIAVFSYSKADTQTLQRFSFFDIFRKETYSSLYKINNLLGVAGAYVANVSIESLFGYFSAIIPVTIIIIGFTLFRRKGLYKPVTISVYLILLMVFLSGTAGLSRILFGTERISGAYCGATGNFISSVFYYGLGSIGASIIFVVAIGLTGMLLVDGNILKSLARMRLLWEKIKEKFKKEKEDLTTEIEEKKVRKEEAKEESSIEAALRKEREKIKRAKTGKVNGEETMIKETGINRPKSDLHSASNEPEEEVEEEIIEKPKEDKLSKKRKKDLNSLLVDEPKKVGATEIDINPENSNELDGIESKQEDDFVEEELLDYKTPPLDILESPSKEENELISDEELKHNGRLLQEKLLKFGIEIIDIAATPGPVVTLYELVPAPEVKLSKIESLQDDIALAMKARGIRMIIPIPGKGTVGVEIPNSKSQMVRVKSVVSSQKFLDSTKKLTVAFGKMIDGEIFVDDLSKMPHVLIAGATGSGKSVGINTIIASLLYKMHPSDLKFVMIDPKKIELSLYSKLRNHFVATSNDINESIVTSPQNAVSILKSVEMEMEQRYDKLANAGVRNIDAYNEKYKDGKLKNNEVIRHRKMPYIVVIIDELADLMITAKRDIEEPIARIAQMARAVGIHLIVATQRPSVDVITGVIKANFPIRIAYQVASKIDSRTILDMSGADQLLRNGDMLYLSSASPKPIRIQNAYISTEECERLVDFIASQKGYSKPYLLPSILKKKGINGFGDSDWDEMFPDAARLILKLQNCSTSTLQRRLKLGYARAARIVDQMEAAGIVGPNQGAKGREILVSEDELEEILMGL
ncbi:MAG: DNA translocase FtsK 4TM domain-containing protein [Ignavibacteria bacterium]|nr:DNA translocase FtsK 4TM domain-containing protein [Ignavibacteria bacterium]